MRGEDTEVPLWSVRIFGLQISVFLANKKTVASWRRWGSRILLMETKRKSEAGLSSVGSGTGETKRGPLSLIHI